jgi:hypothetical protein
VKKASLFVLLLVVACVVLQAKDYTTFHTVNPAAFKQIDRLKVFLEGRGLDFNYIRRNIDFIDFVNDPKASDVHIIVTQNQTGGGGINYILNFYSSNFGQIGDFSLNCIIMPGDTPDMVREFITRTLKLGLMPYINETNDGSMIQIQYTNNGDEKKETPESIDKWKNWVFRIDANGGFRLEQSISRYNYSYNLRADKITEKIKIRLSYFDWKRNEEIRTNGNLLTNVNINKNSNIQSVYSLSESWSAGLFISYFQSTFLNTRHSLGVKPAIEYNFFPWDEADKRVFTIAYFAGLEVKNYYETTIFGKKTENLWAHNLKLNFELVQPWGGVETRLEGSSYFHDLSKNRITFSSGISFRITRGLSFNVGLRAENVHNQLYLPARGISIEDILMGKQKLPSTFELSGDMGIRIQFGSLYNNVINNRL